MVRIVVLALVLLLGEADHLFAQDRPEAEKSTSFAYVEKAPVLDGILDDSVWNQAVVVDDFHQVRPVEYSKPTQRTEFLLAYDKEHLYIGARVFEEDPSLVIAKVLKAGRPAWSGRPHRNNPRSVQEQAQRLLVPGQSQQCPARCDLQG